MLILAVKIGKLRNEELQRKQIFARLVHAETKEMDEHKSPFM